MQSAISGLQVLRYICLSCTWIHLPCKLLAYMPSMNLDIFTFHELDHIRLSCFWLHFPVMILVIFALHDYGLNSCRSFACSFKCTKYSIRINTFQSQPRLGVIYYVIHGVLHADFSPLARSELAVSAPLLRRIRVSINTHTQCPCVPEFRVDLPSTQPPVP